LIITPDKVRREGQESTKMACKFISERNLKFLLYEVFDVALLTQYDYYKEYDGKMLDMVLKAAMECFTSLVIEDVPSPS
jgi:hypothetical protein